MPFLQKLQSDNLQLFKKWGSATDIILEISHNFWEHIWWAASESKSVNVISFVLAAASHFSGDMLLFTADMHVTCDLNFRIQV